MLKNTNALESIASTVRSHYANLEIGKAKAKSQTQTVPHKVPRHRKGVMEISLTLEMDNLTILTLSLKEVGNHE